jgi:hypothetical protein
MGSNDFGRLGSFSFCCSICCGLLTVAVVSLSHYQRRCAALTLVTPSSSLSSTISRRRMAFSASSTTGIVISNPIWEVMSRLTLRDRIATLLELDSPVHLLVGHSWEYDVLDHLGSITDRVFPGTTTPCHFLQGGSRVNVYFTRPGSASGLIIPATFVLVVEALLLAEALQAVDLPGCLILI